MYNFGKWYPRKEEKELLDELARLMMASHSSTLAWKISWMEEPGRLQSMGLLRVRHDWATSLSLFPFMHWRRKWQPTPVLLPGESQGQRAWWASVYGVAQSRTRLKWLSSSSSNKLNSCHQSGRKIHPKVMIKHIQCWKYKRLFCCF